MARQNLTRWARWVLPPLLLVILGGWLLAQNHGLWYDELYTAEVASLPVADIVDATVRGEGTIPYLRDAPPSYNAPYYLAAHLWLSATGLAADEWGLRLLSLVAAAAAMAAFTAAVTRLAGPRVGLVAGLVAASNPFVVRYAAEARGYGIALLTTALAALGLAGWLTGSSGSRRPAKPRGRAAPRSGERRALLLYGAAGAAAGLAHWFALLVLVAFALAGLALRGRRAWPLLAATAAACVPALGLVLLAVVNGVGASGVEWIAGVDGAGPRLLLEAWAGRRLPLLVLTLVAAAAGLLLARDRASRWVAGSWAAVPVALVTLLELVRPVFVARYLLPAGLGLAMLMALGLARLRGVMWGLATAVVLVASLAATVAQVNLGPTEDVRGAVAAVAAGHRSGQPVVAAARWDALGLDHYARHDHPSVVADLVLPPAPVPSASTVWVVRRARAGVKGDGAKLAELDAELARRGMRILDEARFDGRSADVLVQRWERAGR